MGGSGLNQARRARAPSSGRTESVAGAGRGAGLGCAEARMARQGIDGGTKLGQLLAEALELGSMAGGDPGDPPVQLLQHQVGALQDVLHEPFVEALSLRRQLALDLMGVEGQLSVDELPREVLQIATQGPTAPIP